MSIIIYNGKILNYNGTSLNFNASEPLPSSFIFEVNVINDFELPVQDPFAYDYDFTINWGDGIVEQYNSAQLQSQVPIHSYSTAGIKQISIEGLFPKVDFSQNSYKLSLTRILQWGNVGWLDFEQSFRGCHNLISANGGTANVMNQVTNTSGMFASEQAGDQMSLNSVSLPASMPLLSDMSYMFRECASLTEENLILPTSIPNLVIVNNMFRSAGLTNFVIPSYFANVESLNHTFRYCPLETITFPLAMNSVQNVNEMIEGTLITNLILPESMSSLSYVGYWFGGATNLQSIVFPKTLLMPLYGNNIFQGCTSLQSIDLSNSNINGTGLDLIFTNLPTVTIGDIIISGSDGENTCTPSIATSKGWTVS